MADSGGLTCRPAYARSTRESCRLYPHRNPRRFLDQLAHADPGRVDGTYVEQRLGLKGGDVRAFLQPLRVLGLIEPYGETTPRARRMRAAAARGPELRQALAEAYPELVERWERRGGMARDDVEDFFKVEYGLSTSSAGPAAKLFVDLMWEDGGGTPDAAEPAGHSGASIAPAPAPQARDAGRDYEPAAVSPVSAASPTDVRLAALDAIKSSCGSTSTPTGTRADRLVFDRMEGLVGRILEKA